MYQNIPEELKILPQWVNAKVVKRQSKGLVVETKAPFNPNDPSQKAKVNDPNTWGTFEQACLNVKDGKAPMIGFVFTREDAYCGIDLDKIDSPARVERRDKIIATANSYTETSPSGKGIHVIVRAVLGRGRRRDGVEMYSEGRFFTFTGNIDAWGERAICDGQDLVNKLALQMNVTNEPDDNGYVGNGYVATETDWEILDVAYNAANANKFYRLFSGRWEGDGGWSSHSEADLALMSMFTFYTNDDEQCKRLFLMSGLVREKTHRPARNGSPSYMDGLIRKFRGKQLPPVDIEGFLAKAKQQRLEKQNEDAMDHQRGLAGEHSNTARFGSADNRRETVDLAEDAAPRSGREGETSRGNPFTVFPRGLIGEIAEYTYSSAQRPVREVALVTALALAAGVCGRAYNYSNLGLNLYLAMIVETGRGKEAIKTTMDRLLHTIAEGSPAVPDAVNILGPGMFASGPAFIRTLDETPCFVSVLGEFGITLKNWCDERAPAPTKQLKAALLDCYGKSGQRQRLASSAYADKEKNTKIIRAPNVTIVGESAPEEFFEALDGKAVRGGFLPRLSVIEYKGYRPPANDNAGHEPDHTMVRDLRELIVQSLTLQHQGIAQAVDITDEAAALLKCFDLDCDDRINSGAGIGSDLWTRAHVKVFKFAALIAVGVNYLDPVIEEEDMLWAINFVTHEINEMIARFARNEVGDGEGHADRALRTAFDRLPKITEEKARHYKMGAKFIGTDTMPLPYLRHALTYLSQFKNDRRGASTAISMYLADQVRNGVLVKMEERLVRERFGTTTEVYSPGPEW